MARANRTRFANDKGMKGQKSATDGKTEQFQIVQRANLDLFPINLKKNVTSFFFVWEKGFQSMLIPTLYTQEKHRASQHKGFYQHFTELQELIASQ